MGAPTENDVAVRHFAGHASHVDHFDAPLRVVHVTDMHVGRVTPIETQVSVVRAINAANPDVVLLTGDFVCHSQVYLEDLAEITRSIDAPVFAVLGNHDYWSGAEAVHRTLTRAGAEVLRNQWTRFDVRGQQLQIVGLDDSYTGHQDLVKATHGLDRNLPSIGLSHIGEEADALWQLHVPLVLAGHTHAGQLTVSRLHELLVGRFAGHKYVHGLYGQRRGEGALYVGAGVGAAVFPLRLGERAQREVAIFDLGTEPGSLVEHHAEQPALPGRAPSEKTKKRRHLAVKLKEAKRQKNGGA